MPPSTSTQRPALIRRRHKSELYVDYLELQEETSTNRAQALPDGLPKRNKGVAIPTDKDDGSKPAYDLPSPSKSGAVEVKKDADGKAVDGDDVDERAQMALKTGWAPRIGWPTESVHHSESLLDHSTWLEGQIPDKFYGGMFESSPPPLILG